MERSKGRPGEAKLRLEAQLEELRRRWRSSCGSNLQLEELEELQLEELEAAWAPEEKRDSTHWTRGVARAPVE